MLVTVAGTTYYLNANAFYRRVMNGAQETFVVVTPPAGVVLVPALPADFDVVQLNTMYSKTKGQYIIAVPLGRRQGTLRAGGSAANAAGGAGTSTAAGPSPPLPPGRPCRPSPNVSWFPKAR